MGKLLYILDVEHDGGEFTKEDILNLAREETPEDAFSLPILVMGVSHKRGSPFNGNLNFYVDDEEVDSFVYVIEIDRVNEMASLLDETLTDRKEDYRRQDISRGKNQGAVQIQTLVNGCRSYYDLAFTQLQERFGYYIFRKSVHLDLRKKKE